MERILTKDNINEITKEIIKELRNKDKEEATILAFFGDLGVGKTTMTKELAGELGVSASTILSPTFVIMKKYKTNDQKFKNLIHIDAYRLDDTKDLKVLGWEDFIKDKENLIVIEWSEKIKEALPKNTFNLELGHKNDTTRTLKFWYN